MAQYEDGAGIPDGNPMQSGDATPRPLSQRERLAAMAPKGAATQISGAPEMTPPAISTNSRPVDGAGEPLPPRSAAQPTPMPRPARPTPIAPAAPTPPAGAARQIWDIEQDAATTRPLSRQIRPPEQKAEPLVLRTPAAGDAAPASSATPAQRPVSPKAKTRILGFHAQNITKDVFEQASEGRSDRFPAGWIVVVDGPGRGASFTVSTSVSTIGRGEDQAISLDFGDMSISRENHASVAYDDEQNKFFIGHGGKSNVVRRNDTPVLATEALENGDLIRIGKTTLRFVALCGSDFSWGDKDDEMNAGGDNNG